MSIDQELRRFVYEYFSASALNRLQALIYSGLVTEEMAEMIPIEFFQKGKEEAQSLGSLQRLWDYIRRMAK